VRDCTLLDISLSLFLCLFSNTPTSTTTSTMSIWKNGMGKQQVYNRRVWGNGSHHQQQQIDIYNPISISISLVRRTRQSNKETLDGWRSSRRRNDNVLGLGCGIGIGSSHGPQTKVLARVQVLDLVDLVLDRALGKERHLVVLHSCRLEHTHVDCELGVWREAQQVRAHSGLVERAHEGTHCSVSVSRGMGEIPSHSFGCSLALAAAA